MAELSEDPLESPESKEIRAHEKAERDSVLEKMLALREAENPGFRAQWEANQKRRAAETAHDPDSHLGGPRGGPGDEILDAAQGLRRVARALEPAAAFRAFEVCMAPLAAPRLAVVALAYRENIKARAHSDPTSKGKRVSAQSVKNHRDSGPPPGKATKSTTPGEVVSNLERIGRAAEDLANALQIAARSPETMAEIETAATLGVRFPAGFPLLGEGVRHGRAWELPGIMNRETSPWLRRLEGLRNFSTWIAEELRRDVLSDKPETHWDSYHSDAPDLILHREILDVFRENGLKDRYLQHVARAVRAWALGLDLASQGGLEPFWGKDTRTLAREWWKESDRRREGARWLIARQKIEFLMRNHFEGVRFRFGNRTGKRKD